MSRRVYASIDLGGTNIAAALGLASGEVLAADASPTRSYEGPERVVARIERATGLTPEPGQTLESFLESVAAQARDSSRYR